MNRTMMKIAAAGALLLLAACGKDDEPAPTPSQDEQYTVYVAGSYDPISGGSVGCYWKDGELFTLTLPDGSKFGWAEAIEVHNGSVYVLGNYDMGDGWTGGLWKDGNLVDLNIDFERNSLNVFTVSDGSFCFGGFTLVDDKVMPCCWIDGVQRIFDEPVDALCEVTEIAVSGDKVYLGGAYWVGNTGDTKVCYWNDGKFTLLGEPGNMDVIEAKGIVVSKGRVCVLGSGMDNKALLWIDDNLREYDFPQGVRNAFSESLCMAPDGSIYMLGSHPTGACWWDEAGKRTDLKSVFTANDIAAADGSVYIAGLSADKSPCYWKNGRRFDLSVPENLKDVEVSNICVVKK